MRLHSPYRYRPIEYLFAAAALTSVSAVGLIFIFMIWAGIPLFKNGLFFKMLYSSWSPATNMYGIFPMIIGSCIISMLAVGIAFPVGLGVAFFTCLFEKHPLSRTIIGVVKFMTGIPTVLYGFTGIFLLVPIMRKLFDSGSGLCILSAGCMLALLITPTVVLFITSSFKQVPQTFLTAMDAMGGTKAQKLLYVTFPCAANGIVHGAVLAFGRALGDTMISLMIAGNAVGVPASIFDSARTLTAHIALVIAADFESIEFKSIFACGMVLYLFTALVTIAIRFIISDVHKRW